MNCAQCSLFQQIVVNTGKFIPLRRRPEDFCLAMLQVRGILLQRDIASFDIASPSWAFPP
jgi:hypothetical protein